MTTSPFVPPAHWITRPSVNQSRRTARITAIVLHADAASRLDSSLDWVCRAESRASYHVMIGRTGSVYLVVPPERKAWHAGQSMMDNHPNVNEFSIGVCLSNRNDGDEEHPPRQVEEAVRVCALLCGHFGIAPSRITTHALIATPPGRKTDPRMVNLAAFQHAVQQKLRGGSSPT